MLDFLKGNLPTELILRPIVDDKWSIVKVQGQRGDGFSRLGLL